MKVPEYQYLLENLQIISEKPDMDTSGYDNYAHWDVIDVISLPDAKAGLLETANPVEAYFHIETGKRHGIDSDLFIVSPESPGEYFIKFTPEDPSLFSGNIFAKIHSVQDGNWEHSILSETGSMSLARTGYLNSSPFIIEEGESKFFPIRVGNGFYESAEGPATYELELIKLTGVGVQDVM